MLRRVLYTDNPLDRAGHLREDQAWLAERLDDATSRVLPVWRGRNLLGKGEPPAVVTLAGAEAAAVRAVSSEIVFLGQGADGAAWFAADLSEHGAEQLPPLANGCRFADLRQVGARLGAEGGGVLAYARAIVHWHQRHRFCGCCGRPTRSHNGGHMRVCDNTECGEQIFPRTDPVVIMLVEDRRSAEPRCLLARQPAWPRGLVSTLAGFVEPGETLEQAVAREVREEAGLEIGAVRYFGSQPWPFPCSLMLGFRAEITGADAIAFDRRELEDALWFSRDAVRSLDAQGLKLPYAGTMSRALIDDWLQEPLAQAPSTAGPPASPVPGY